MQNDFYTFIVTSTINAKILSRINLFDSENRFKETLKTLESIRRKVPNAKIVFVDNSTVPLSQEQVSDICAKVDVFEQVDHNPFTIFCNEIGSKGMGEAYLMFRAMKLIEENNLLGKRIFKITGRYRLADSFDIDKFNDPNLIGKYAFKINQWDVSMDNFSTHRERVVYFETRLWSFCSSLFNDYKVLMQTIFNIMISNIGSPMCNWEMAHWKTIPHDKVYEVQTAHVEGYTADDGVYKFE